MNRLGIAYTIVVLCSLIGVQGFGVVGDNNFRSGENIDRDDLLIPEVIIDKQPADIAASLRPIFEAVWNAAGLRLPQIS